MRSKPVLRKTNQIRTHSVVGRGAGDPAFSTNIKTNLVYCTGTKADKNLVSRQAAHTYTLLRGRKPTHYQGM